MIVEKRSTQRRVTHLAVLGPVTTRQAQPGDASRIAQIHVESWRAAYAGLLPDALLRSLRVEQRAAMWHSCLESGGKVLLAEGGDGRALGFLCIGAASDDDMEGLAELKAIYVDPGHYGSGVGTALWEEAEKEIRTNAVYLWALAANALGKAFYAKQGFVADGFSKTIEVRGKPLEALRYVKALPRPTA